MRGKFYSYSKGIQRYSFNFGPSITNWIMLCYQNIESCVLNNGWASNFFALERGVRRGWPLSPYIFLLCVEILAERIRTNKDIEGIFIKGNESKISQYADDTTLILDGAEKSFTVALHDLELFSTISDLKLNKKKTEALWIGSYSGREDQLCPEKNLKWVKDKVRSVGVWISTNPTISINENYRAKLEKIRSCLNCWEYRRLTLLGKVVVLKSLIASQLVYMLSPLLTNQQVLGEINNIFYKFWDGKRDKIKRSIMISDYENGGLKMLDLDSFNKVLKLSWVRKYLNDDNNGKWKLLFDSQLEDFGGGEFFRGKLDRKDVSKYINVPDPFITEIVQIWTEMSFEDKIKSIEHLLSLNL